MNELLNAVDPPDKPEDDEATAAAQSDAREKPRGNHPSMPFIQKNKPIRVLIADDHPLVRKGIKQCINDDRDMEVVGESGTALGVFEFLNRDKCDVLVLDIGLPDRTGLDVRGILKKTHPAFQVFILSL